MHAVSSGLRGTLTVGFVVPLELTVDDDGYRLEFIADYVPDGEEVNFGRTGAFDNDRWIDHGLDIFSVFSWYPDISWQRHPRVRLPFFRGGTSALQAIIRVPSPDDIGVNNPADDNHTERWWLLPDFGSVKLRPLSDRKMDPPDMPGETPPLLEYYGHAGGNTPSPVPIPIPTPIHPTATRETVVSPPVTATNVYWVNGSRSREMAHLLRHCPALQQAEDYEIETLDEPLPAELATSAFECDVCGHCLRIMQERYSPELFAAEDGSMAIFEDRLLLAGNEEQPDIVLHAAEIHSFSSRNGLALHTDAGVITYDFNSDDERESVKEALHRMNLVEK